MNWTRVKNTALAPMVLLALVATQVEAQNLSTAETPVRIIDFEAGDNEALFTYTDASAWKFSNVGNSTVLELSGTSSYEPRVRSPLNIAMLNGVKYASFVLEADLRQTGKEYGHRDMCLFFGIKDASNFYYVHLASQADANAHNIFLVNDEPRRPIATRTTQGIRWGDGWNKIRLVRDVVTGSIQIYFNDMETPIMEAVDMHFDGGYLGFGSFDDTGMIDNIRIYGTPLSEQTAFFGQNK
ncbi:MAG: hypothetical protein OEY56_10450 [Cyclobacteriaceae bacterium]|nr:hypothetical protein [Cyclobacteriaceae bacterium]